MPVFRTFYLLSYLRKKHTSLNGKLSGGGRKEEVNLLQGLQLLLQQHSKQSAEEPSPSKPENVETRLLAALKSLVERASNNPEGLLDRLRNLVDQAAKGQLRGPSQSKKRQRKREKAQTKQANQSTESHTTADRTFSKSSPSSTASKNTAHRTSSPVSWSDVVQQKPNQVNSTKKSEASRVDRKAQLQLDLGKWEPGSVLKKESLTRDLGTGNCPTGKVILLHDLNDLQLIRKMLQAHAKEVKIAALFPATIDLRNEKIIRSSNQFVRTQASAQLQLFNVVALQKEIPDFPDQNPIKISSAPSVDPGQLATFKVQVVQKLIPAASWKLWLVKPAAQAKSWCEAGAFHSSLSWRRNSYQADKHKDETVLEGFIKVRKNALDALINKSGQAGIFLERVKDEQPRRFAVQWEPRENDETDLTYYQRLLTAKRPLAYRKGRGAFLGFRDGQVKQQPRLCKLQGVPHLWGEDELLTTFQESKATDIEIISGPQRRGNFGKSSF